MTQILQVFSVAMLATVIITLLNKQSKDIAALLSIAVVGMILLCSVRTMQSIISFLTELEKTAGLDPEMMKIMLKIVGIAITAQLSALICSDNGNGAFGKAIQIYASVMILWQSLPLLRSFLELLQKILGEI